MSEQDSIENPFENPNPPESPSGAALAAQTPHTNASPATQMDQVTLSAATMAMLMKKIETLEYKLQAAETTSQVLALRWQLTAGGRKRENHAPL